MAINLSNWGRSHLPRIKNPFKKPDEFRSADIVAHDKAVKAGKTSTPSSSGASTPTKSGASTPSRSDTSSSLSSLGKSISPPQLQHASSFPLHDTPEAFFNQSRKAPKPRTEGIRKEDIAVQWESGVTYKGGRHTKPNEANMKFGQAVERQSGGPGSPRLRTAIPSSDFGEVFDAGGAWRLSLPAEKKPAQGAAAPKVEETAVKPAGSPKTSAAKTKGVRFADEEGGKLISDLGPSRRASATPSEISYFSVQSNEAIIPRKAPRPEGER